MSASKAGEPDFMPEQARGRDERSEEVTQADSTEGGLAQAEGAGLGAQDPGGAQATDSVTREDEDTALPAEAAEAASVEEEAQVDTDAAAVEVEGDLSLLESTTRERDDYLDALRRLQADFENYKKRMVKQQTDYLERAAETLVAKLLPVLDTAELAVNHGGGSEVEQVRSALIEALEKEGLERIDPIGEAFDPTRHDAVAHEPAEGGGGQQVSEVMRLGYSWKGRVLRPAMVKVRG